MTQRWFFALPALLAVALAPTQSQAFGAARVTSLGGPADGTAVGDTDGDGRLEVAVIVRAESGAPSISLFDDDGSALWALPSPVKLGGFPAMGDFDGDGHDEVAFCEMMWNGMCRILDADGSELASMGPFYYAGMTTAGPAVADVNGDTVDDLLVASYGGLVGAYDGAGAELWSIDVWADYGEQLFGHPAVADLEGDGDLELVVAGYLNGDVYAIDVADGTLQWRVAGLQAQFGNYAYANGALLTDLDGDGAREVVLALSGADAVFVFEATDGAQRARLELPGAWLSYMSPVAGDVDGDTVREVLLQGSDGVLRELVWDGSELVVARSVFLGDNSWVAPSFVDTDQDNVVEILASTQDSLLVLDGQSLGELDRYDDVTGGLMPTTVAGDTNRDRCVDLVTASWWGETLLWLDLPSRSSHRWSGLGGGGPRHGEHAIVVQADTRVLELTALGDVIQSLIDGGGLRSWQRRTLRRRVLPQVAASLEQLLQGDAKGAIEELIDTIRGLQLQPPWRRRLQRWRRRGGPAGRVQSYDTTGLQELAASLAVSMARDLLARAAAVAAGGNEVNAASNHIARAQEALASGDFERAAVEARRAADELDAVRFQGDHCGSALQGLYLVWECELVRVHGELKALERSSEDAKLRDARASLERALEALVSLNIDQALDELVASVQQMTQASADTSDLQAAAAKAAERLARIFLDDAAFSELVHESRIDEAEAYYAAGVADRSVGELLRAVENFAEAAEQATPYAPRRWRPRRGW